jgi:endonuclease/exonuclease/phosphatase (EEP) superfamily protein YafD
MPDTISDNGGADFSALPAPLLHRCGWWSVHCLAWLVAVSLAAAAMLRIFYHDATFPLIWLNSFTCYVYLPIYLSAAWALWQRRWPLLAMSLVVAGCHVVWMAPDFLRDRRFDPHASAHSDSLESSPVLRIFYANVAVANQEHASLIGEIAEADPDVVVLVEFGWPWHNAFKASPVMAPYKYGTGWLQSHIGSVNVFSRRPLRAEMQNWVTGRAVHSVDVDLGGRTLRIIGLHAPRPIDSPRYNYRGYWKEMIPLLKSEPGAVVIVGDFNATEHSRVYQELTSERLRSAHDDRGRGYATTWPNGEAWLPPIRIDQALLAPQVECLSIREGVGRGSDHRPLILDVRIRERSAGRHDRGSQNQLPPT